MVLVKPRKGPIWLPTSSLDSRRPRTHPGQLSWDSPCVDDPIAAYGGATRSDRARGRDHPTAMVSSEVVNMPRDNKRSALAIAARWISVVLLGVVTLVLGSAALAGPCKQGTGSPAFVFAVLLGAFAAVVAGGPTAVVRLTGWRPSSLSRQHDGFAGCMGLVAVAISLLLIPDLVPGRIACNERSAIQDLRSIAASQQDYSKVNGGLFAARMECLAFPARCLPDWDPKRPGFLPVEVVAESRHGYSRSLNSSIQAASSPTGGSHTGASAFACVAAPIDGTQGARGFCVDSTGYICATKDGTAPPVSSAGACDRERCAVLKVGP